MMPTACKRWHTDMQDLLEKHLDEDISRALKFETTVTPAQKAAAWERLQARVQQQPQLPPILAIEASAPLRWLDKLKTLRVSSVRLLHSLILDSAAYERASAPRYYYPYADYKTNVRWVEPANKLMCA